MAGTSLYRRYRPRRFSQVLGQEHAVRALQNAVRNGNPGHAYLFSGPRGTGKTSSARILARALNCLDLSDGEPCGSCDSCVAIEEGRSLDLHEHDAASRRRIDEMRDLLGTINLGSPGNYKVYILDEVHQLTGDASSALLKALEEPPAHVVWVLATTDPQKVLPTIRSRTQHFDFSLLPPDVLEKHVRHIVDDAGLGLDDEAIAHVVRAAKGSARDALSALDRVAAAGGIGVVGPGIEGVLDALVKHDVGAVLADLAQVLDAGRDPRTVCSELVASLRDHVLAIEAPTLLGLPEADREAVVARAEVLGRDTAVRAIEVLGTSLVDMKDAPDPRVVLEVGLLRVASGPQPAARPGAGGSGVDLSAVLARLDAIEGRLGQASTSPPPAAEVAPSQRPPRTSARERSRPVSDAPPTSRRRPPPAPDAGADVAAPSGGPVPAAESAAPPAPPAPMASAASPSRDEVTIAWAEHVLEALPRKVKARFASGRFVSVDDGVAVFGLANQPTVDKCEEFRGDVEAALSQHFGTPLGLRLVVDDGRTPAGGSSAPGPGAAPDDAPEPVPSGGSSSSTPPPVPPRARAKRAASDAPDVPRSRARRASAPPPAVAAEDGATGLDTPEPADEHVDLDELTDAPDAVGGGVARLAEAFPGITEVADPPG